ncbi:MAG: ferritin family protein [Deltaproteobacteria bacterium]|nr:ferritin family protein [Deltaproteobacteria bacterium]
MIYPFNAREAFKIAVAIEENGLKFYQQAAKKFAPSPISALFENLAQEEVKHKQLFSEHLAGIPEQQSSAYDPNNETDMYLKMMADLHVFSTEAKTVEQLLAGISTPKDALVLAMGFEKDSIVFFVQLKNASDTVADKFSVDLLIIEEAKHLKKLAVLYNNIDSIQKNPS